MASEANKKKMFWMLCLTIIFMISIQAMDLGASLKIMEISGIRVHAEGLIFTNVEPRILYHAGLLLAILCWVFLCIILIKGGEE